MTDLQRILDMAVRMDAHEARKARDIFDGRLRELEEPCLTHGKDCREDWHPWRQATAHLPYGLVVDGSPRQRGLELQAGLEEAVRRETARLEASDE